MAAWMLISTLFAAEPMPAAKSPPAKVYVVYVTVVEVDAEGNETVLFTPKVQTTGNPAGATVEHVDGRSFEFNCKMATSAEPALERPPSVSATKKPFQLTVGSTQKKAPAKTSPLSQVSAAGSRRHENEPAAVKRSPPHPNPLSRSGSEGTTARTATAKPVGEYSVRTYDVSALIDAPDDKPLTEAHFAPVIQTIKAFAEVESWDGQAAIKPFVSTKSLVIKQTAAGHKAVAEALNELQSEIE